MRMESPYVVTIPEALGGPGDSAPATAFGVFQGMRACLREVYGSPLPQGRTVAVQGAGAVGKEPVRYLVPRYRAAGVLSEQRIAMIRQVKSRAV